MVEATLSKTCNAVKDAEKFETADRQWLDRQIQVAAANLSVRPIERRGPFEISDELIGDISERFSISK
ncbi:hypothetical protein N182_08865 [Sinorhizobium sp. GL2]|nr:hypothetical protein N182_08865 [Sinorhizobium sp. GL2]